MIQTWRKKLLRFLLGLLFVGTCILVGVGVYNVYKPLPSGISFAGPVRPVSKIAFYKDLTWAEANGKRTSQQEIFDKVISMIEGAQNFVLLDMFLFNDFIGLEQAPYRRIAQDITDALVTQKTLYPTIQIVVITDPINTVYNGMKNHYFERLKAADIQVVFTKLERLRDSNPVYSAFWRIFVKPLANSPGSLMPNPFGDGKVSLRSYLAMLNFKANHRKIIITDTADEYAALITSANPHDGSSAHGNVAIYFTGPAVLDLLESEKAVLRFSGGPSLQLNPAPKSSSIESETTIQILSEGKIKEGLITALMQAGSGDTVSLVAFYLSDRDIIAALRQAYSRGAELRVLLDPNKDAFGRQKNGIPNRQVADELVKLGIPVKWSNTHGEQSHTKMLYIEYKKKHSLVIMGSANFTRRNLNNFNLETDIAVQGLTEIPLFIDIRTYIDLLWNNNDGKQFSVDYNNYADNSLSRQILYQWMEKTGMSTF